MTGSQRDLEVAIVGAGPHGLSSTLHLRRSGVEAHTFGDTMSFWRDMPRGMFLRSNWSATNIAEPSGPFSLNAYKAATGADFGSPVPLQDFIDYGAWFQRTAVTDVDARLVANVEARAGGGFDLKLDDGAEVSARRVVVACGIEPFVWMPAGFDHLPPELCSHTGAHRVLDGFAGRRVAVVGGGQSALECAALMSESGAEVDVFIRREQVVWLRANSPKNALGPIGPVVYAPTDVGPLWYSRLVATPGLFRRLPRGAQDRVAYRSIRPACSNFVRVRLDGVTLNFGRHVLGAEESPSGVRLQLNGSEGREFDHVMFGTGYRVDVTRYPFLASELLGGLRTERGYPVLRRGLESSVPGLHFVGAPAAYSFGPITRFVSGSWYCGKAVARAVAGEREPALA